MAQPVYKSWKDKGDNVGVQCLVCYRTHWTGHEPNTDPTTGQPCQNCEDISTTHAMQTETEKHKQELLKYADDRSALAAAGKNPNSAVLQCTHLPSQP